jgi:ribosomal protein L30
MRASLSLAGGNLGLRQPQYNREKLFPRPPPNFNPPFYHPLRAQYPHPAVHHVSCTARKNAPPSPFEDEPKTHFRIQLKRSALGLPEKTGKTLHALGLNKRDRIVYHPMSPAMVGSILKIKELVHVKNVGWKEYEWEMCRGRGEGRGWLWERMKTGGEEFTL